MAMEHAIYADCSTLIENFVKSGNPRFESFCVQWKRMMFQHIYSAQSNNIELLQTTAAVLNSTKRIVCGRGESASWGDEEQQLLRRIGGMFLMYAIYQKQPTEKYVKIEVSPETWSEIRTFIEELPMALATDDVRYIYWSLLHMNAFSFTALDYCVGLENLIDYDTVDETHAEHEDGTEDRSVSMLKENLPQFSATQKILPALTILEDGYNEMKEMLVTAEGTNKQALPPTNIFKDIRNSFTNIQKMIDECKSNKTASPAAVKPKTNSEKRNLKRKGYKVTHSKDDIEINSRVQKNIKSQQLNRRMSVRTIFSEKLPDEMLSDLQEEEDDDDEDDDNEEVENPIANEAQKNNDNDDDDDVAEIINSSTILEKYENKKSKVK